jgi:uncharacterized protein with HEPN domain
MSRSLDLYLEDIIEAIRKIRSYTSLLNFEEFCVDERTVDAVIRNLIVVGEAFMLVDVDFTSILNKPALTRRYQMVFIASII